MEKCDTFPTNKNIIAEFTTFCFYRQDRLLSVVVKPRYDIDPLGRQYFVLLSVLMAGFIECYGQDRQNDTVTNLLPLLVVNKWIDFPLARSWSLKIRLHEIWVSFLVLYNIFQIDSFSIRLFCIKNPFTLMTFCVCVSFYY